MCGWMAAELADHTQGLPNQPSAEGAGKWSSSPAPGPSRGMQITPAAFPREGRADGSVFPAPAAARQSHPEQLCGSDALLAVTAPSPAHTARAGIPGWSAPQPLPGLGLQGRAGALGAFRAVCSRSPAGRARGELPSQIRPLSGLAAEVSVHFLPGSLRAAPCGFPGQDAKRLGSARSCSLLSC